MLILLFFVLGTVVGSFLNVVIIRLHAGQKMALDRSRCRSCGHVLAARDLVPLLSWLWLRGRCRFCSDRISLAYFLVEATTGLLFVLAGLSFGAEWPRLVLAWLVLSVLVVVFVYDFRFMLIPTRIVLPTTAVVLVANLFLGMSWRSLATGMLVTGGFFWLQRILSRGRWIGGGDVKLGLLMGVSLGLSGSLVALFLAYVFGAAVGLVLLTTHRRAWRGELPFGTFLSAASAVALLWGGEIAVWYLGLISF